MSYCKWDYFLLRLEGCDSSAFSVYLRAKNCFAPVEYVQQMPIDNQSTSAAFRMMVSHLEVLGRTSKRLGSLKIFRDTRRLVGKSEFRMTVSEVVKLIGRQIVQIVALASISLLVLGNEQEEKGDCREPTKPDKAQAQPKAERVVRSLAFKKDVACDEATAVTDTNLHGR